MAERDKTKPRQSQNATPLCLFHFSHTEHERKPTDDQPGSYIASTRRTAPSRTQKLLNASQRRTARKAGFKLSPLQRRKELSSSDDTDGKGGTCKDQGTARRPNRNRKQREWRQPRKLKRPVAEHARNLTSYLFTTAKTHVPPASKDLPSLTEVLDTVKDAWPSEKELQFERKEECKKDEVSLKHEPKEPPKVDITSHRMLPRRRSVPEEIIRKFNVSKDRTSESETNATMPEVTSPSSKEADEKVSKKPPVVEKSERLRSEVFSHRIEEDNWSPSISMGDPNKGFTLLQDEGVQYSAEEGSSDSDSDAPGMKRFNTIKRAPLRRSSVVVSETSTRHAKSNETETVRLKQQDYYKNGRGVLQISGVEKSCQTGECTCQSGRDSWTTISAKDEESESDGSSESISSPQLCTRALTSSDNQSSDSDHVKCTCAELTSSKDTSSDPYHSGKSTLSQSVSDKSVSTQDSTVSINSISTRGSSISPASNSSSPDIDPRTSAKETTTSPDQTPRTNSNQRRNDDNDKSDRRDKNNRGNSGRGHHSYFCPMSNRDTGRGTGRDGNGDRRSNNSGNKESSTQTQNKCNNGSPLESKEPELGEKIDGNNIREADNQPELEPRTYEWTNWSEEEVHLIQDQRNRKFVENNRKFSTPLQEIATSSTEAVSVCSGTGSSYQKTENLSYVPLMIPRYSALPRSLSMVVNSSSFDTNHYSDSDCHSLSDSLEDGQNGRAETYFDTKHELKPVRGDVNYALTKPSVKHKEPRGRAFFVAIDKEGDSDLVTNIYKIPEPPESIRNKIQERHTSICKSHKNTERIKELANTTGIPPRTIKTRSKKLRSSKHVHEKTTKENRVSLKKHSSRNRPMAEKKLDNPAPTEHSSLSSKTEKKELTSSNLRASSDQVTTGITPTTNETCVDSNKMLLPAKPSPKVEASTKLSEESKAGDPIIRDEYDSNPTLSSDLTIESAAHLDALHKHRLSLISSLESAASALLSQQLPQQQKPNRQNPGTKRPSNLKFQQKFEVIPEERSSSLSSAEDRRSDKDRRHSLPVKLSDQLNSPRILTEAEGKSFRRYSLGSLSNYIISKLMGRPLQAIPCVQRGPNNQNQQIIIFSPKDSSENNSSKGRDALLAMNREDFDRLSKGWMNFYLLKEGSDDESAFEDDTGLDEDECTKEIDYVQKDEYQNKTPALVCKIPTMNREEITPESCTDDPSLSPGRCRSIQSLENKSYSLQMKDVENGKLANFVLVESCDKSPVTCVNDSKEISSLGVISEEMSDHQQNEENTICSTIKTKKNEQVAQTNQDQTKFSNSSDHILTDNNFDKPNTNSVKITREASTHTESRRKVKSNQKLKLSENLKFGCSNTVLRTKQLISVAPRMSTKPKSSRGFSLPELHAHHTQPPPPTKSRSLVESLPRIPVTSGSDEIDSDCTVYMQAPSPQVPRLPLEGCGDFASDDSASSNSEAETTPRQQFLPQRRKGPAFRNRHVAHGSKSGNPGWSVTVAGTVAFPQTTPDLQMRLSFPVGSGPPVISQSDSGFVEDGITKPRGKQKQQWTVTVNPNTGGVKEKSKTMQQLRSLSLDQANHSGKKVKESAKYNSTKARIEKKFSAIWPKVQQVIENEFNSIRQESLDDKFFDDTMLSVRGKAVLMDTKPKPAKMSDRDITRNTTARSLSMDR